MRHGLRHKAVIAAALGLGLLAVGCGKQEATLPAACTGKSSSAIGGPFSLIDQDGRAVTDADFKDRPSLFYFGFTYCPDVCPLTLTRLRAVADELGRDAAKISTVFVTVDPKRDTPEALKLYLSNPAFPAGTKGLTGSEDQVKDALMTFKVASQITIDPANSKTYEVSHTSIIYLMGQVTEQNQKKWQLRAFFADSTPPADIATCVKAAIDGRL
jgi:protein SCO1